MSEFDTPRATPVRALTALLGIGRKSELAVGVAIGLMLALVAVGMTIAPRALQRAESSSLERAIAEAPAVQRRLAVRAIDNFRLGGTDDPLRAQRDAVEAGAEVVPDDVASKYGEPRLVVDTNRFLVRSINGEATGSPTLLTFRVHPELEEHSRIVEGRAAQRPTERSDARPPFEFELSTIAAEIMELSIGDELLLGVDPNDTLTRRFQGGLPDQFVAKLVGLRELDAASDLYWFGDARLHRPTVSDTGLGANFFVFGSIGAEMLPRRPFGVALRSPFFVEQRRDLLPETVTLASADALFSGLVALEASSSAQPSPGRPGIVTGLRRVLAAEEEQRTAATSTVVLAATGVVGVALATLAQALQVAFARRRGWLTIARARGASNRQVIETTMVEVGLVAGVALIVGSVIGRVVMGGSATAVETRLLLGLWIGAVALGGLLAAAEVSRPVESVGRAGTQRGLGRWGRIVGALLVVVAGGALVTFRRRGLDATAGDIDALVVLVPVLVPLAFVFLTRWVLPFSLGLVARVGMRFGPGRLIGLRRAIADPGAGAGLIGVLTLALTVAGLGLGVNRSLESGITDASWNEVGAPFRIDSSDPQIATSVAAIADVELAEFGDNQFRLDRAGNTFAGRLINIQTDKLAALTDGTAAALAIPDSLKMLDADDRVPVVAAARIGGDRVRRGDVFSGTGSIDAVEFVVAQVRTEAFGRDRDWVVADRAVYELATGRSAPTTSLIFDIPADSRPVLDELVESEGLAMEDRALIEEMQRDDPLVRLVRVAYVAAGVVATLLALMAVVGLSIVTARQRRREVSVLGLLGAERAEIGRAVRSELVPPVLAGVVVGTAFGWLMITIFDGRFDLSSFANGTSVALRPDVTALLVAAALTALASGVIVAVLVRRIVHVRVNEVLRLDDSA